MKTWIGLVALCACGTEDTVDPPLAMSALARCVTEGGSLAEAWSVANQHGPVTTIVADRVVVLGSQDGSVKQWSVDGDEPSYGTPFTTAGAPVSALALSDEYLLAGTTQGQLAEWTVADVAQTHDGGIPDVELGAVAIGDRLIAGTSSGELFAVERGTNARIQLSSTLWGVSAISYGPANALYTAGHWYFTPMIERRAADAPMAVVDAWNDQKLGGQIRALAWDANVLVAAGDHVVAVFAPEQLGAPLAIATPIDHEAVGVVLLQGGELLATAGKEGTLRVWRTATAELVSTLAIPPPIGLASDPAGTRLYTSGADGRLHAFGCR